MKLLKKDKEKKDISAVQTAGMHNQSSHPFSEIDKYIPLQTGEQRMYAALREAVPVIDSAICKIVRLIGTFEISCKNKTMEKQLNYFVNNVQVNGTNYGMNSFISSYLDQMLTYGTAVGEIIPDFSGYDIKALYNASLEDIELSAEDNPLNVDVYVCRNNFVKEKVPYKDLILVTALNPQPGEIKGTSILKGLPFVSSVFLKIANTIGVNWERIGNVRFAVTYKPSDNMGDMMYTKERAMQIADEWSKAMRGDCVSDFVSVGDVDIKVIGADNQILECQTPSRLMLEQIVSKLSIPPFLLGLSWSSTERMSSQQADILTSELEYYRNQINPVIQKICKLWLRMHGCDEKFEIIWNNINLQDEVELANARLSNAQAQQIEKELEEDNCKTE